MKSRVKDRTTATLYFSLLSSWYCTQLFPQISHNQSHTFYYINEKNIVLAFHPCITLSDWLRKSVNYNVNKNVRKSDILINKK